MSNNMESTYVNEFPCPVKKSGDNAYELKDLSKTYESLCSETDTDDCAYSAIANDKESQNETEEIGIALDEQGYIPMADQSQGETEESEMALDEQGYIPMSDQLPMEAERSSIYVADHAYLTLIAEPLSQANREVMMESDTPTNICELPENAKNINRSANETENKEYSNVGTATKPKDKTTRNTSADTDRSDYSYVTTDPEPLRQKVKIKSVETQINDYTYGINSGEPSDQTDQYSYAETEKSGYAFATPDKDHLNLPQQSENTKIDENDYALITTNGDFSGLPQQSSYAEIEESDYDFITIEGELPDQDIKNVKTETDSNDYACITTDDDFIGDEIQNRNIDADDRDNSYTDAASRLPVQAHKIEPNRNTKCTIRKVHVVAMLAVLIALSGVAVGLKFFLGSVKPTVTISPSIYSVTMGQSVTLQCIVSSNEAITSVAWQRYNGGGFTDITSTTNPDKYNGSTVTTPSLTIADADFIDTGSYTCFATNSVGTGSSNQGTLFVTEHAPNVNITPTSYSVNKGQSTTIHCQVSSYGTVTSVTWTKNTSPLKLTDPKKYRGSTPITPSLTIDNADVNDAGNYTCVASNNVGTGSSNVASLTVITEPTVAIFPSSYSVSGGQHVTIQCNISSIVPVTSVSWQKMEGESTTYIDLTTNPSKYNGSPVTSPSLTIPNVASVSWQKMEGESTTYINLTTNPNKYNDSTVTSPSLTILNVEPEDAGNYTCSATNSAGTGLSNSGVLSVTWDAPIVNITPTNYSVNKGRSTTIHCHVSSYGTVTSVTWKKNALPITSSGAKKYRGSTPRIPSLSIDNADVNDAGNYTCFASNNVGTGSSNVGSLTVFTEPTVKIVPSSYSVTGGQFVTIQCSVESILPVTSVSWRKIDGDFTSNIDLISNPNKFNGSTVTSPFLTIDSVEPEDAGNYTCSATNNAGTGSSNTGFLYVTGSEPIVNLSLIKYTVSADENVTIQCGIDSDVTIKYVSWQRDVDNATIIITANTNLNKYIGSTITNPSLTIVEVDSGDAGNYTCFATNGFGTGSSHSGILSVKGNVPTVNISPSNYSVTAGQSVTIQCRVYSNLTIKSISWGKYIGNFTVTISSKTNLNKYLGSTLTNPSLTIADADSTDAGSYVCFATNGIGTGSSNHGKLSVTGVVPTVNISPSNYSVTACGSVTIQCSMYSNLTIKSVSWRKYVDTGSTTITPKTNIYKYSGSTVDTPSLTIYNAIPDDAGSYTCSVTNSFGTGSSNTGTLSVTGGQSKFEFVVINLEQRYSSLRASIMIYSSQSGSLKFKGTNDFHFYQNQTLNRGQNIFSLPKDVYLRDGKQNKTLRIISSVPIDLSVVSKLSDWYEDGSYVIPKRHLSTQYVVPTFTVSGSNDRSQIGITSLDTPSQVNITIHTTDGSVSYDRQNYNDGEIIEQFLAPYESLQISHVHDLSGTTITASAPIAVMAGNRCGSVLGFCTYFIENILPVDQQDTEFIVPIIQNVRASVVRVYSYYQNNVSIFSNNSVINKVIEPGGWYQFNHSSVSYIKATSYILVMLYPHYKSFMMTIHGKKQYKSEYFFVVPDFTDDDDFLSFSIYGNNTDGFEMDGKPLLVSRVTTKIVGNKIISSFWHEVAPGAHRVTNTNRHSFGLWVYGNLLYGSYGFLAGIHFN